MGFGRKINLLDERQFLGNAIEQGQNFSAKFQEDIRIVLPIRSAVIFLPDAIRQMMKNTPAVSISPSFDWQHGNKSTSPFLRTCLFFIIAL